MGHNDWFPAMANSPALATLVYVTPSTTPVSPTSASSHTIVTCTMDVESVR